jgi:hypothetical protein
VRKRLAFRKEPRPIGKLVSAVRNTQSRRPRFDPIAKGFLQQQQRLQCLVADTCRQFRGAIEAEPLLCATESESPSRPTQCERMRPPEELGGITAISYWAERCLQRATLGGLASRAGSVITLRSPGSPRSTSGASG